MTSTGNPFFDMLLVVVLLVGAVVGVVIVACVLGSGAKSAVDREAHKGAEAQLEEDVRRHGLSPDVLICLPEYSQFARAAAKGSETAPGVPVSCMATRVAVDASIRKLFVTLVDLEPGWPVKQSEGVFDFDEVAGISRDNVSQDVDRGALGVQAESMPMIRFDFASGRRKSAWLTVSQAGGLKAQRLFSALEAALSGSPAPSVSGRATQFAT